MRVHITLDEADVRRLDARVGSRQRSSFIAAAVRQALDDAHHWELVESAIGGFEDGGHEWDADAAAWVHEGRHADARRRG